MADDLTNPASPRHLLEVQDVKTHFESRKDFLPRRSRRAGGVVRAVDGVSFAVESGEMLALVGESGCGKTTTAQTVMRLVDPVAGRIIFQGLDITALPQRRLRHLRRHFQMIYQDPYESLNPRYRVEETVAEPLRIHGRSEPGRSERELVLESLARVDLHPPELFLRRFPHELSGGQRQRVAIAASLIVSPALLVADEPVSMLDVSVRAGIMALLRRLCDENHIGILMITHDLAVAAHYADRIAVMYLGRIVETGPAAEVLTHPTHPYTMALLRAAPHRHRVHSTADGVLAGEAANAMAIPTGCRFQPRCPLAEERCGRVDPELRPVVGRLGHQAACVLVGEPSDAPVEQLPAAI